jgi:hypothetical protein
LFRITDDDLTPDLLVSVLKLSAFFQIEDGRKFAIARLPVLTGFHPAEQLALAILYDVEAWIEPAFRLLIDTPCDDLNYTHIGRLGLRVYHIITKTKCKIDEHHRTLAFCPPDAVHGIDCFSPNFCSDSWSTEWSNGIAKQMLHPDVRCSGPQILSAIQEIKIPGMCMSCQTATLRWIEENGGLLREGQFIAEGLQELRGHA